MGVVVIDAEVTLTDVLSLRVAPRQRVAEGSRLVFRQRGTGIEREVRLGTPDGWVRGGSVAVRLAPLALTPGRWDAYLQQDGPRTRIQSMDPGFSLDRLDAYALSRRSMAYRAYRTRTGYLAIKIDEVDPFADVRAVWLREGRFEVTGLLAYTGVDDDDQHHAAWLTLRQIDSSRTHRADTGHARAGSGAHRAEAGPARAEPYPSVTVAATVRGVRFHAALSLCDVLAAAEDPSGVWEPSLRVERVDCPLPLAARLDDIDGKRRRVHYPSVTVDSVPIKPNFTADDVLRLEVSR